MSRVSLMSMALLVLATASVPTMLAARQARDPVSTDGGAIALDAGADRNRPSAVESLPRPARAVPPGRDDAAKSGSTRSGASKNAVDDASRWDRQFGVAIGCDNAVKAMAPLDDGRIVVGGLFHMCGNVQATFVAIWDPNSGVFAPLSEASGAEGTDYAIDALAVNGNRIVVSSGYSRNSVVVARNIALYDLSTRSWSPMGSSANNGVNNPVTGIAMNATTVFVTGSFSFADGVSANRVARYDIATNSWSSLGTGSANGVTGGVNAIALNGTDVYVAGTLSAAGGVTANKIARFDTTTQTWSSVGTGSENGLNGTAYALATFGSRVYVGGSFTLAGTKAANNVASFDIGTQSWQGIGAGTSNGTGSTVYAVVPGSSELYVGGSFSSAGTVAANRIARFQFASQSWDSLGTGSANGANLTVRAIVNRTTEIYVAGNFTQSGGVISRGVARYTPATQLWSGLGVGTSNGVVFGAIQGVSAIKASATEVYAGGDFTLAGDVPANNFARFDIGQGKWTVVGNGAVNGLTNAGSSVCYAYPSPCAMAIDTTATDVFAGGSFQQAGDTGLNLVARFNLSSQSWLPLSSGANNGTNSLVRAIAVSGQDVFLGGDFVQAPYPTTNSMLRVARYNLTAQTWNSLGTGSANGVNNSVYAVATSGQYVYVGGSFTLAGGATANRIARFDLNSQTWSSLGTGSANGVGGQVRALAVSGNYVYAGGNFTTAGGQAAANIARFDTTTQAWSTLGSGAANGVDGIVEAISISGSDAFVGGSFLNAGGASARRVAIFNTSTLSWRPLPGDGVNGVNGPVYTLSAVGTATYIGGSFSVAGGVPSMAIARYDNRRDVTASLSLSPAGPVQANTAVSITASVATLGFPGQPGKVDFYDNGAPMPGCSAVAVVGGLNTRTATCTTSALRVGSHSLVARYLGDTQNFVGTTDASTLVVTAPVLDLTPSTLPNALAGVSYSATFAVSGSGTVAPLTYSLSAGSLPNGLTLLSNGQLSGVPNTPSTFNFTITGVDSSVTSASGGAFSVSRAYTVTTSLQTTTVTIGTISPEPSVVGQSYSVPVVVTGQVTVPNGAVVCSDGTGGSDTRILNSGSATCVITSSSIGTKTITALYNTQGNFEANLQTKPHVVNDSNQAPVPTYTPNPGTAVDLTGPATQLGDPAAGQVAVTVGGGLGNGNVSLGCSVTGGNFTLNSTASVSYNVGDAGSPIVVGCTRLAAEQSGPGMALNCTETSNPGANQRTLSWPLRCPAATAVPPTLTYSPAPGNAVVFPTGTSGSPSLASIQVTGAGAVGNGSTTVNCTIPPADTAFSIVSGNGQTVTAGSGGLPIGLRCALSPTQRTSTLTCVETEGPVLAQRSWNWPLTCPPGQIGTTAKLTVGSRTATRGQVVSVPVSFAGETPPSGSSTVSVTAQINYDNAVLGNPRAAGAGGGQCTVVAASHVINVSIPNLGGALPVADTRYCDLQFDVAANAPSGASALSIGQANCQDAALVNRQCSKADGRVAVAALAPLPGDGAAIVIGGHVSDVDKVYAVQVSNNSAANRRINACTFTSGHPDLSLAATPALPLTILPAQKGTLTLACHLPPINQQYAASLSCTTDDPMRALIYYDVVCRTFADGAELPSDQLLNDQQRSGEQEGRSAAMANSAGNSLVALGAPLGGGDGNGRVALYESAPGAGKGRFDGRPGLRLLATLESPTARDGERRSKAVAALVTDLLGQAVAIRADGGEVAVGAPNAPTNNGPAGPGRVYRYVRPAGGWANFDPVFDPPVVMDAPTPQGISLSGFGSVLAYSATGDLLAGAPGSTANGTSGAGAVVAFPFAGQCPGSGIDPASGGACTPGASLFDPPVAVTSPTPAGNGNFGAALAVSGSEVFVGAPAELASTIKPGNVYRIDYILGTFGTRTRLATTSPLASNDKFGSALAISGDLLLVGAPGADNAAGTDAGAVLVFRNLAAPTQVGLLLPGNGATQSAGSAIAANADTIYVGAPTFNTPGHTGVGRVYAFPVKASYTLQESPTATLDDVVNRDGDDFGRSLAVGFEQAVVGVPKADATLFDGTTLTDTGRADPFVLAKPDLTFGDGFE